jgi:hypothetical protein
LKDCIIVLSELFVTGFAAQSTVATSEREEVRNLEQSVSSEDQENSPDWFESSADNSDSPGRNLHEACCSLTARTASRNDSSSWFDNLDVCNKLTKKQVKKNANCSICDRTQNMEPCMSDI